MTITAQTFICTANKPTGIPVYMLPQQETQQCESCKKNTTEGTENYHSLNTNRHIQQTLLSSLREQAKATSNWTDVLSL